MRSKGSNPFLSALVGSQPALAGWLLYFLARTKACFRTGWEVQKLWLGGAQPASHQRKGPAASVKG